MTIDNFRPFAGQHCETTATGCLLKQIGIELSEPMLFGLGEGLGFVFWNMKTIVFPFIGGRIKTDLLTENLCRNLNLQLEIQETSSKARAWENVRYQLDKGKAVGLKLDCYHLDYFTIKFHFAGHYVAMYGYDEHMAYLVDTDQQGGKVTTSLDSLQRARDEKGPMSSRNRSYVITKKGPEVDLSKTVGNAIKNNTVDFLNPPIKNIGYKGILKASLEIKKWFTASIDVKRDFQTTAMLMERAGTGGSLFRNLYRDFLRESADLLSSKILEEASQDYETIAGYWKTISDLFMKAGETKNIDFIDRASKLLIEISELERKTMHKLGQTLGGLSNIDDTKGF